MITDPQAYQDFIADKQESLRNDFIEKHIDLFAAYCQDIYDEIKVESRDGENK